jgi:hypothetical protein
MLLRLLAVSSACVLVCALAPPHAFADPDDGEVEQVAVEGAPPEAAPADVAPPPEAAPPPPDDGRVESSPPASTSTPDGWTLTLAAQNETQMITAPLTTAISTREYVVGGTYNAVLTVPEDAEEEPHGTLEVGYQIGCGIDMSTSNGVSLTGTMGVSPQLALLGVDGVSPLPEGLTPGVGTNIGGGETVGLKPGLINVIPVTKKEFTGAEPWVMINNFRVKIDGCVGESFIRSYAFLTRSTAQSDAILAWYGVIKKV